MNRSFEYLLTLFLDSCITPLQCYVVVTFQRLSCAVQNVSRIPGRIIVPWMLPMLLIRSRFTDGQAAVDVAIH